jgi:hypothetical protein
LGRKAWIPPDKNGTKKFIAVDVLFISKQLFLMFDENKNWKRFFVYTKQHFFKIWSDKATEICVWWL